MIDVLIPIVDKPQDYLKAIESLRDEQNLNIIVGVTAAIAKEYSFDAPNVTVQIFKNGSKKEEVINALQRFIESDNIFVARKPFTREDLYEFINADADIVTCQLHKGNAVTRFFRNLWALIIKYIFGVKFFQGDTSLIYFNEGVGSLLDKVNNLSYATRIDRWRSIKQETIQTSYPRAFPETDFRTSLTLILCSVLSLAVGLTVTLLVALLAKVTALVIVLLICLDIVCVFISLFLVITYLFNRKIGKRDFMKAAEAVKGE